MRSILITVLTLFASTIRPGHALGAECDRLLEVHPEAQRAIERLIDVAAESVERHSQGGLKNRIGYAVSRAKTVYRAFRMGLASRHLTPQEKARVCAAAEGVIADESRALSNHEVALIDLARTICEPPGRNGLGVFRQGLRAARTLRATAEDTVEMTRLLLDQGRPFDAAVAATSLPKERWSTLASDLGTLDWVLYRLLANPADRSVAADLRTRLLRRETTEAGIDWSPDEARDLIERLLYRPLGAGFASIVNVRDLAGVFESYAVLGPDGRPLNIAVRKWMSRAQRVRAEIFFGEAMLDERAVRKEERKLAAKTRRKLLKSLVTSADQFVALFDVSSLVPAARDARKGERTRVGIRLQTLAEVYFPALRIRLSDFLKTNPSLDQVRTVLELWTQFPELSDDRGFDVRPTVRDFQFELSLQATGLLGTDLRDVMRLMNFAVPEGAVGASMKTRATLIAFNHLIRRGDGRLAWIDQAPVEGDPLPAAFDVNIENSAIRLLLELRGSLPEDHRTEADLYRRAVELLAASADVKTLTDPAALTAYYRLVYHFELEGLRKGLFNFLLMRSVAPNRGAEIVMTQAQAARLIPLAADLGPTFAKHVRKAGGETETQFNFAIKIEKPGVTVDQPAGE